MKAKRRIAFVCLVLVAKGVAAAEDEAGDPTKYLQGIGAGPAFYVLHYNRAVIADVRDVRLRGDGTIDASETRTSTSLGLEVHYNFGPKYTYTQSRTNHTVVGKGGWAISPYLGIFDVSSGVNGIALGILAGVWRADKDGQNKKALNAGIGYFVHKNRLVLANDVRDGGVPPAALESSDYTRRRDVSGVTLTISASIGF